MRLMLWNLTDIRATLLICIGLMTTLQVLAEHEGSPARPLFWNMKYHVSPGCALAIKVPLPTVTFEPVPTEMFSDPFDDASATWLPPWNVPGDKLVLMDGPGVTAHGVFENHTQRRVPSFGLV